MSDIWTPDRTINTRPDTESHDIGGLPMEVPTRAPPAEVQTMPPHILTQVVPILAVQVVCLMREVVALRERVEALEKPAPPDLVA